MTTKFTVSQTLPDGKKKITTYEGPPPQNLYTGFVFGSSGEHIEPTMTTVIDGSNTYTYAREIREPITFCVADANVGGAHFAAATTIIGAKKPRKTMVCDDSVIDENDVCVYGDRNRVSGCDTLVCGDYNRVSGCDARVYGDHCVVSGCDCHVYGNDCSVSGTDCKCTGLRCVVSGIHCKYKNELVDALAIRPPLPEGHEDKKTPDAAPIEEPQAKKQHIEEEDLVQMTSMGTDEVAAERELPCEICLENKRQLAVAECGHLCLCFKCAQKLIDTSDPEVKCPKCRCVAKRKMMRVFH